MGRFKHRVSETWLYFLNYAIDGTADTTAYALLTSESVNGVTTADGRKALSGTCFCVL